MGRARRFFAWLLRQAGRIRVRLLAVNLLVALIPVFGLEFARIYERQLLDGLERDMKNQAALARSFVESLDSSEAELDGARLETTLGRAAQSTRTRIRIVARERGVVADSHRSGPPEGREPPPPLLARDSAAMQSLRRRVGRPSFDEVEPESTAALLARPELQQAFAGVRATRTRVSSEPPAVFLFLAEPLRHEGKTFGAVYLTRSTSPVLFELHRIRRGLLAVLMITFAIAGLMTLALAWTISRPLERLSRAARRIAAGEMGAALPSGGGGEISELSQAFVEMTKKLEARQRYISEFAADVAHEFKSPLTSIRGAAENITLDAERLDRLVSRLLELSRIDAAEAAPSVVALEELLERVVERAESPTQRVVLDYASDVRFILARGSDLESAFINLVDNALRAAPHEAEVHLRVSGNRADGEVQISVEDRGHGIPPELLGRIFERFFSTDSEGDGTGLGLAIVKSAVEAHGGRVEVESRVGVGSVFRVRLPLRVDPEGSKGRRA